MRFILFSLLFSSILVAQESEHTCRTLFLNGPQQAASDYYLFDGTRSQKIELPRLSFSPVYKVRAGDITRRLLASPVEGPDKVPEGAPSVTVPAGTMDFYLLIANDPANQVLPLRMQPPAKRPSEQVSSSMLARRRSTRKHHTAGDQQGRDQRNF